MEISTQNQEIIIFAKQLANSNLEPGQYDLIIKEYIRFQKKQEDQNKKPINSLEWLALLAGIFGTIFLGLFLDTVKEYSYPYLFVALLYFTLIGAICFKGKACSN